MLYKKPYWVLNGYFLQLGSNYVVNITMNQKKHKYDFPNS